MKNCFIKTFGCQANKADSERMAAHYKSQGYTLVDDWRKSSLIIINTCAVRQRAEDRVIGLVRNIDAYFAEKSVSRPKIVVTGCILHLPKKELKRILPTVNEFTNLNLKIGFNENSIRQDKKHAWIPISSGCNSFCSYCVVPYARGKEISRPMKDILCEAEKLLSQGYEQITLLGKNVNSYGLDQLTIKNRKLHLSQPSVELDKDFYQSFVKRSGDIPPFVLLLQELSKLKGLKKIYFMTANPWDFWDELIDEIAVNKKIDRYIHLPIQSGSDRILKLMNRGYTTADYLKLVKKIQTKIPDVVLGTDIIVGFPGETEKDFQDTINLVKQIDFKIGFVAQYSPRPGTAAFKIYPDDIPPAIKKKRWEKLDKIINKDNLNQRPELKL